MSQVYLDWLADEFRAAGLRVVEVDRCSGGSIVQGSGWKRRGRSGGVGYQPGRPLCVMWHHTAAACGSSPNGQICDAITRQNAAPIANVFVWCDGTVYVLAAGPTNTNGQGWAMSFSRGTVPADSMNSFAFGMEIVNNGVGGAYPQVQIDVSFTISNIVNRRCGNRPTDVAGHVHYTNRKIDPATANAVQGPWRPRSINSSGSWSLDDLRAECNRRAGAGPAPGPTPIPDPEDDEDMPKQLVNASNNNVIFWWDGAKFGHVPDPDAMSSGIAAGLYKPDLLALPPATVQNLINSSWAGGPVPPGYSAP